MIFTFLVTPQTFESWRRCAGRPRRANPLFWRSALLVSRNGLSTAPKLAIGDGSLGFWIALQEEYGAIAQQRCWVHKTANILDKMPKSVQDKAKQLIHEMYLAPTRKAALAAYDQFISSYQSKFPKACECLEKDKEVLFTFTTFRPNIGRIYGPPTPSNPPSLLADW